MKKEVWRPVPGYPGVRASSWGRVWFPETTVNGRTYRTAPTRGQLGIYKGQARYIVMMRAYGTLKIARLVCLAFKGLPPAGRGRCLHIDENPANNRPGNLRWGTQKENLNAPGFLAYCRTRTGDKWPGRKV
jgi:hypothetical protein